MVVFAHAKWMKAILRHHTSYMMSSAHCEDILASVYAMIEAKTRNYNKILQLRGKLEMMVQQVSAQPESIEESVTNKEALLIYQDDSSDELNDKLDEMLMPASDTDNDDWNEEGEDGSSEDEDRDVVEVDDEEDDDDMEEDQPVVTNGVGDSDEDDMEDD